MNSWRADAHGTVAVDSERLIRSINLKRAMGSQLSLIKTQSGSSFIFSSISSRHWPRPPWPLLWPSLGCSAPGEVLEIVVSSLLVMALLVWCLVELDDVVSGPYPVLMVTINGLECDALSLVSTLCRLSNGLEECDARSLVSTTRSLMIMWVWRSVWSLWCLVSSRTMVKLSELPGERFVNRLWWSIPIGSNTLPLCIASRDKLFCFDLQRIPLRTELIVPKEKRNHNIVARITPTECYENYWDDRDIAIFAHFTYALNSGIEKAGPGKYRIWGGAYIICVSSHCI